MYAGYLCMMLETCCISFFRDRYVGWAATRGVNKTLSSSSVCIENGLIYKVYSLQRYSDKKHKFLFSGTRVKYLDYEKKGMHSLYEPAHGIWTYGISTKPSNNRLFCCV